MAEKLIKLLSVVYVVALILVCCATHFRPYVGMREKDFIQHYRMVYWNDPVMSYADDEIKIYTLGHKQYYYFEDGRLFKIDQGELQQERREFDVK